MIRIRLNRALIFCLLSAAMLGNFGSFSFANSTRYAITLPARLLVQHPDAELNLVPGDEGKSSIESWAVAGDVEEDTEEENSEDELDSVDTAAAIFTAFTTDLFYFSIEKPASGNFLSHSVVFKHYILFRVFRI